MRLWRALRHSPAAVLVIAGGFLVLNWPVMGPVVVHNRTPEALVWRRPPLIPANKQPLFVPMDSRTLATATGTDHYRYTRIGGTSWAVPWTAGLYALVCQVYPAVTPAEFLQVAVSTGDRITLTHEGKEFTLGPIVNSAKVIEHFEAQR